MSIVRTLEGFTPGERVDAPWTQARIEEAASPAGPWVALQTINMATGPGVLPIGLDADPEEPQSRTFTTTLATLSDGYYRIVFIDAAGHEQATQAVSPETPTAYTSIGAVRMVLSPDGSQSATLGTAASLSDEEIEEAIEEAAAEITARLSSRYSLPFDVVPSLVEKINRDIAAYMATLTYRRNTPLPDSDPIALRYARALALLTGAQKGDIQLVDDDGDVGQAAEAYVVNTLGYEGSLFTLEDFSLVQAPFRGLGIMPGGPFDGEGF